MSSIISDDNDSKLKCPECEKVILPTASQSVKQALSRHKRNIHQQEYKCNDCDEVFPKHHQRQRHFEKVHKQLLFGCSHCDSSFGFKETLNRHMDKVHTQANCTACNEFN